MRKLMLISFLMAFAPIICLSQGIKFEEGTLSELKAKAQQEHKYVFIDCYATWCGPCKAMDKDVYTDISVGEIFNSNFISAKFQFDRTSNDPDGVTSRYADVEYLKSNLNITGFPTLLYFDPKGNLVLNTLGFKNIQDLKETASFVLSEEIKEIDRQINTWRMGNKNFENFPELIITVRDKIGNKSLAIELFNDYKRNYLNHLTPEEHATKKLVELQASYADLITSSDTFFKLILSKPQLVQTIDPWIADEVKNNVITREEILNKLWKNDLLINKHPDWTSLADSITLKYGQVISPKIVFDAKLFFYKVTNDWPSYAKVYDQSLKGRIFKGGGGLGGDPWQLNLSAWDVYKNTNDIKSLEKALKWVCLGIETANRSDEKADQDLYDTKARLLYKLGRRQMAINVERISLKLCMRAKEISNLTSDACKQFQQTLNLMMAGKSIAGLNE